MKWGLLQSPFRFSAALFLSCAFDFITLHHPFIDKGTSLQWNLCCPKDMNRPRLRINGTGGGRLTAASTPMKIPPGPIIQL
jgi:hypothetical protein